MGSAIGMLLAVAVTALALPACQRPSEAPPPTPERACNEDADCGPGLVCVTLDAQCRAVPGTCVAGCSNDADCTGETRCRQPQCVTCPCPKQCSAA